MYSLKSDGNYYTLARPRNTLKKALLFLVKLPIMIPSKLLSALVTVLAVNPANVMKQRMVHRVQFQHDKSDQGIVIINVSPRSPFKLLSDFFAKAKNAFIHYFPFFGLKHRQFAHLANPKDKAYVDKVIREINLLLAGKSTQRKCENVTFLKEEIHLKGLEHLDKALQDYLHAAIPGLIKKPSDAAEINFFSLETPGGAVLDSVAVSSQKAATYPFNQRKFVIACLGRDQNVINWIKDFRYTTENANNPTTVIGFNYRGSDRSQGMLWSQNNMINDALAQVRRLLLLGVPASNITLEGHCIGGNVATIAAAKLHEQNYPVRLYSDRSFRSIRRLLVGLVWPTAEDKRWHPVTWLKYLAAAVQYLIVAPAIWITNWRMDAATAWNNIPQAYKDYSVVRNFNDPDPKSHKEDGLVENSWASIASLVDENRNKIQEKHTKGEALTPEERIILNDKPEQHYFKANKPQVEAKDVSQRPHWLPRRSLIQTVTEPAKTLPHHMISHCC